MITGSLIQPTGWVVRFHTNTISWSGQQSNCHIPREAIKRGQF